MKDITASELTSGIKAGWNLGNTLDAVRIDSKYWAWSDNYDDLTVDELETGWVKHKTTKSHFDFLCSAGFNAVRIPVSWHKAVDGDYNIRAGWLERVREIVDYAVSNDMFVLLNTHHDEFIFKLTDDEFPETKTAFTKIWEQIAGAFRDYNEKLILESLNEPRTKQSPNEWKGGTPEEHANLNALNQLFVDIIRASGGSNDKRILLIPTYAASKEANAMQALVMPADTVPDKIIVSIHTYAPNNFCFPEHSENIWSLDCPADVKGVTDSIDAAYDYFVSKGIPVIIGEICSWDKHNTDDRTAHAEFYAGYAKSKGIPVFWWDNGSQMDRNAIRFYHPEVIEALVRGAQL